jgi:hypothetical protein
MNRTAIYFGTGGKPSIGSPVTLNRRPLISGRHGDRSTGIYYIHTAHQTFGTIHGNGTNTVFTKVLFALQVPAYRRWAFLFLMH